MINKWSTLFWKLWSIVKYFLFSSHHFVILKIISIKKVINHEAFWKCFSFQDKRAMQVKKNWHIILTTKLKGFCNSYAYKVITLLTKTHLRTRLIDWLTEFRNAISKVFTSLLCSLCVFLVSFQISWRFL